MCLFQMEQDRISALAKKKADLFKQQRDLVRQLQLGVRAFMLDNF